MRSFISLSLFTCGLLCLIAPFTLARDIPAIARRQVTKTSIVERASHTRPKRQGPSQVVCNQYKLQLSSTANTFVGGTSQSVIYGITTAAGADTFTIANGMVQRPGAAPSFPIYKPSAPQPAHPIFTPDSFICPAKAELLSFPADSLVNAYNGVSYVYTVDAPSPASVLSCSSVNQEIVCIAGGTNPPTPGFFQVCETEPNRLIFGTFLAGPSCVSTTLTAVPAC